jgi:flagellar biosynthesis protein FlhB
VPSDRKTEAPTPRRLRRARRDGDHPISRALVAFGALGVVIIFAPLLLEALFVSAHAALLEALTPDASPRATTLPSKVGLLAAPLLAAAAVGALVTGLWQTGGVLSTRAIRWDLGRLSPWRDRGPGLRSRTLSMVLSLLAALATSVAAWLIASDLGPSFSHSIGDAHATSSLAAEACRRLGWWALGIWLAFAATDSVFRHIEWHDRQRMTPDEVRQEQRENQGDPELRQARQRAHRELASSGVARDLARASLLVLGAPSVAVALRHEPAGDLAPRVILHGSGPLAATLAALAPSLGVPVEHDSALASALARVPVDQDVPRALYGDIARALQRAGMFRPPGPA